MCLLSYLSYIVGVCYFWSITFRLFSFSIFGDEDQGTVSTILQQERQRQSNSNTNSKHATHSNDLQDMNGYPSDKNMNQNDYTEGPEWLQHWRIRQEAERERLQKFDASHPGVPPPDPPSRPPKRPEFRTEVNIII